MRLSRALIPSAFLTALLAASALPAAAQDYRYEQTSYDNGPGEVVEVIVPRHRAERSVIGAPIEDVALSSAVRFDDLDLTTSWGAHALRERVRETARTLCRKLDVRYPISVSGDPPCYDEALRDAMAQADAAIGAARGYDGRDYRGDD
jgi:UrcA family protein